MMRTYDMRMHDDKAQMAQRNTIIGFYGARVDLQTGKETTV